MRKSRSWRALLCGLCLAFSVSVHSQRATFKHFTQTPTGDWQTTIIHNDGSRHVYTYVSQTKFTPHVDVSIRVLEARRGLISYEYKVENDPKSLQPIGSFFIGAGDQRRIDFDHVRAPDGWQILMNSFYSLVSRVPPGARVEFGGEARALPGVMNLDLFSDIGTVLELPEDLDEEQANELSTINSLSVAARGLAPKIPIGDTLDPARALSAVLMHYGQEFQDEGHPATYRLGQIDMAAPLTRADLLGRLAALKQVADIPGENDWHRSLSQGLDACVQILRANVR